MTTVSIAEAKNQLPRIVQQAETGEAVHITRHGRPVAVLLSEREYERLQTRQNGAISLWDTVQDWRKTTAFDWPGLTDDEVDSWRDQTAPKVFSWDD